MTQRGRPRHPDILTPREWEVLSLVREGLSNPQIGERLGITADAAKYHVSEILSKLGVATREEAAAWRPEPAEAPVLRPVWARVLQMAALAGAAVALAGVGLLAWSVLRSEGEDDGLVEGTETPTSSAGASQMPEPSPAEGVPAFLSGVPIGTLKVGEDVDLPSDVALITLRGCTNCDGPAGGVSRTYRDASGSVQVEPLLWTNPNAVSGGLENNLGLPPRADGGQYAVLGAASDARGGEIMAAVCCTPQTIIFRSTDGGVTWSQYYTLDDEYSIYGLVSPGEVLVGQFAFGSPVPYRIVPDGGEVTPPEGGEMPFVVDGEVIWRADNWRKLISADGKTLVADTGPEVDGSYTTLYPPVFDEKSAGAAMVIYQPLEGGGASYYLARLDGGLRPVGAFHSPDSYVSVFKWLDAQHLLGMASIPIGAQPGDDYAEPFNGFGPVIIDIGTGEVHPIRGASPEAVAYSQRDILAAPLGPFVKATADPCLNIRSAPSTDAPVLVCVASGVLLFDHLHGDKIAAATPIDGWMSVGAPDGKNGYANADFLEIPAY